MPLAGVDIDLTPAASANSTATSGRGEEYMVAMSVYFSGASKAKAMSGIARCGSDEEAVHLLLQRQPGDTEEWPLIPCP